MLNSAVQSFADPWEYQTSIRAADVEVLLTASGKFHAELTRIDMHRLWMQRGETSLPLITHAVTTKDRSVMYFLADTHQTAICQNGQELRPGVIVVGSSGAEHHRHASTGSRWGAMSLIPEDLAAAGRAVVGYELTAPTVTRLIQPPPDLMSRLLHLHEAAGRLAATVPDILAHPEVNRALEQELVDAMARCLASGLAVGTDSPRHQSRLPVMRWFEQVLEENPGKSLYVPEICAAIGVSDRTLRLHCEEHLGMSPHKYLWLRRMHLARRALAGADPAAAAVTGIALDHGFGELGRFAVQYRQLFGESPSATLRNTPNNQPVAPKRGSSLRYLMAAG